MGRRIGEVDFTVDFDGRGLPAKARQIGKSAGGIAGEGFNEGFSKELTALSKELRDDMDKNGELAGSNFTDSMRNVIARNKQGISDELADVFGKKSGLNDFVKQTGDVDVALSDLRDKMRELNDSGGLTTVMYDNLNEQLDEFETKNRSAARAAQQRISTERDLHLSLDRAMRAEADGENRLRDAVERNTKIFDKHRFSLRSLFGPSNDYIESIERMAPAMDNLSKKTDRASKSGNNFKNSFKFNQLPDQLQDIIFIGAIIAALGTDLAVLGSAAGGGIAAIAIGALAAVTGIGIFVAGVKGMTGDLEDIAPAARPAALALKELGAGFVDIKKNIQGEMFKGLDDDIDRLGSKLLPVLDRGFVKVSGSLNRFMESLATRLTTPKALTDMDTLLSGFEPLLDKIFGAALNLGSAIGSVFVVGLPTAQMFFGWLEKITGEFDRWAQSDAGRERIAEWFDTVERVAPVVGNLIGSLSKAIASLVTDDTINKLNGALDGISDLAPSIAGFLETIGKLDPIGLFVKALETVDSILGPLKPSLDNLADSLNGGLSNGLDRVGSLFEELGPSLGPVVDAIADDLVPALLGPGGLLEALLDLAEEVLPDLVQNLPEIISSFSDLAVSVGDLVEAIQPLVDLLGDDFGQNIGLAAAALDLLFTPVDQLGAKLSPDGDFIAGLRDLLDVDEKLAGAGEFLRPAIDGIRDIGLAVENAYALLQASPLGQLLSDLFGQVGTDAESSASKINTSYAGVSPSLAGSLGGIGAALIGYFSPASAPIMQIAAGIGRFFADPPRAIQGYLGDIGGRIAQWFSTAPAPVQAVARTVGAIWADPPRAIGGYMSRIGTTIAGYFSSAPGPIGGIARQVGQIWATPPATIRGLMGNIGQTIAAFFQPAVAGASRAVSGVVSAFASLPGRIIGSLSGLGGRIASMLDFSNMRVRLPSIPSIRLPSIIGGAAPATAVGGVFGGGQLRQIAEAGPEAVVPLNRPLSQVDPAVRALSAFAQGKAPAAVEAGPRNVIEDGAIRITTAATQPDNVGASVLDHLVANL